MTGREGGEAGRRPWERQMCKTKSKIHSIEKKNMSYIYTNISSV